MKKKRKLIKGKSSSLPTPSKDDSKNSLSDIVKARELLPIIEIPQITVSPTGEIVRALFLDYFSDQEYLIAQLIKQAKQEYEKEIKEFEALSDDETKSAKVKKFKPSLPYLGYN